VVDAGMEWVPPLRYARRDRTTWELVNARGDRTPYPTTKFRHPRYWRQGLDVVTTGGAVLSWQRDGLVRLEPGASTYRVLTPIDFYGGLETGCLLSEDRTVEVYEDSKALDQSHGRKRDLLLLERDSAGREQRRASLSLPDDETDHRVYHQLACSGMADRLLLVEVRASVGSHRGCVYSVAADLATATLLSTFDLILDEHVPLSLAVSQDGSLLTTGQAVWRTGGGKVRELETPLRSCVWIGRTLCGIRAYPFLFQESFNHDRRIGVALSAARGEIGDSNPVGARRFEPYRQAWARGQWILGGLDEADRQDEVVTLEFQ
jgi:hypothetical protein